MGNRALYVLELENHNYYIGQSANLKGRLKKHFKGKGSAWTQQNKPIKLIETREISGLDYSEAEILENVLTLEYMKKYSWQCVRGGFFSDCDPCIIRKKLLKFEKDVPKEIIETLDDDFSQNIESKFLYCILLEENRYYIGISKNPKKTFKKYCREEKAASYIKLHKAKELLFFEEVEYEERGELHDILIQSVINLMALVGCYRVRGGVFLDAEDHKAFETFKKRVTNKKFKFDYPAEWLSFEFDDFMKPTGEIISTKEELIEKLFKN